MLSALKPFGEQFTKNPKKAPGWAPLSALCYLAFYLLLGAGQIRQSLVEHKELLVLVVALALYVLWIQVKNELAKMFRSLIGPCGVATIILIIKGQSVRAVVGLVGGGLFLVVYLQLRGVAA